MMIDVVQLWNIVTLGCLLLLVNQKIIDWACQFDAMLAERSRT